MHMVDQTLARSIEMNSIAMLQLPVAGTYSCVQGLVTIHTLASTASGICSDSVLLLPCRNHGLHEGQPDCYGPEEGS